jgi:phytoene synthase
MPLLSETEAADLDACRTKLRAGSKSFDAAARLLPKSVRTPAVALYAFCREADDVIDAKSNADAPGYAHAPGYTDAPGYADAPGYTDAHGYADAAPGYTDAHGYTAVPRCVDAQARADASRGLGWLRERLNLAYERHPLDLPADRAFARIVERFAIPRCLPEALLEGFQWDAEDRRYADLPALRAYAVRVAGTVGAMMAILMGVRDRGRLAAAIHLGVAMQLSNIARDVGEDARNGRLYLPLDWLTEAGIDPDRFLAAPTQSTALAGVVARLLQAADHHYRQAGAGITRLPLKCRLGIGAARLLYAEIGREVARRDMDAVSARAVVSTRRKVRVLTTGLAAMMVPLRPLTGDCVQEGAFLIDSIVRPLPLAPADRNPPWWDLVERMRWTIDLFERLEERQRV